MTVKIKKNDGGELVFPHTAMYSLEGKTESESNISYVVIHISGLSEIVLQGTMSDIVGSIERQVRSSFQELKILQVEAENRVKRHF